MGNTIARVVVFSPDGRHIALVGGAPQSETRIWIHSLETGDTRVLEQAGSVRQAPFWSPDGRSLGYLSGNTLKRIDIAGGTPQTICDVTFFGGGTWTRDNVILFSDFPTGGIRQVSAAGGTPVQLTKAPPESK